MTKNKQKRIKQEKYESEEQLEIKRFVIILVVLSIIILGVYFLTRIFVTKDLLNNKKEEEKVIEGAINYNTTLIGNIYNKPVDEYFVMIYNSEDLNAVYYNSFITNYKKNKDALNVYIADLKNELNKNYYDKDNLNLNPNKISDLRVGDLTLLKISKNKIISSYNNEEEIAKILAYIKDTEN